MIADGSLPQISQVSGQTADGSMNLYGVKSEGDMERLPYNCPSLQSPLPLEAEGTIHLPVFLHCAQHATLLCRQPARLQLLQGHPSPARLRLSLSCWRGEVFR